MKQIIAVMLLIAIAFFWASENKDEEYWSKDRFEKKHRFLPSTAKKVQDLGNGWVTFELGDMSFIFYVRERGHTGYSGIATTK